MKYSHITKHVPDVVRCFCNIFKIQCKGEIESPKIICFLQLMSAFSYV